MTGRAAGSLLTALEAFRNVLTGQPVLGIGLLLVGGWFLGRAMSKLGLPAMAGFIGAGVILGPMVLGVVHSDLHDELGVITEVAVALIAVVIGSEIAPLKIRAMDRAMAVMTSVRLLATLLLVSVALRLTGLVSWPAALLLGAIAAATAPATTVALVRDLKARGSFIERLYSTVALEDAGCVLLFSVTAVFAPGFLLRGSSGIPEMLLSGLLRASASIATGVGFGFVISRATRRSRRENDIYIIGLALVCLMTALANSYGLSPLLAGLASGALLANRRRGSRRVTNALEGMAPPLYAAFFAIAGTEISFRGTAWWATTAILTTAVLSRAAGKYLGAGLGAAASGEHPLVRRYMGAALLPQGGVAVGLALFLQSSPEFVSLPEVTSMVVSVTLLSVMVNELVGAPVSRWAISRGSTL